MFCSKCGKEIHDEAVICVHCGCAVKQEGIEIAGEGRAWLPTLLLSWFLGNLGIHRFYTGYTVIGIVQLLTLGGCGLWSFVDWACICFNNYKDADGRALKNYKKAVGISVFVVVLFLQLVSLYYMFIFLVALATM